MRPAISGSRSLSGGSDTAGAPFGKGRRCSVRCSVAGGMTFRGSAGSTVGDDGALHRAATSDAVGEGCGFLGKLGETRGLEALVEVSEGLDAGRLEGRVQVVPGGG